MASVVVISDHATAQATGSIKEGNALKLIATLMAALLALCTSALAQKGGRARVEFYHIGDLPLEVAK
jgi:hypothetical protein